MRVRKEEMGSWRHVAKTVVVCASVGLVTAALWLLLAAALMTAVDLPDGVVSPIAVSALGLGSLFAGFLAARRIRKNGLVLGTLCGLLIFVVALFAGLSIFGRVQVGFSLFKLTVSVLCGAIGGVLGVGGKKRH